MAGIGQYDEQSKNRFFNSEKGQIIPVFSYFKKVQDYIIILRKIVSYRSEEHRKTHTFN